MQEIKCPKCGETFSVDESSYTAIVKQVRDKEFAKEIKQREESFEKDKKLAIANAEAEKDKTISQLNAEIQKIRAEKEIAIQKANLDKERFSEEKEAAIQLAVTTAKADKDNEINELKEKIATAGANSERVLAEKDKEIVRLENQIETAKTSSDAAVKIAIAEKDNEISRLLAEKATAETQHKTQIDIINDAHNKEIKAKDEIIDYYKDLKAKMSTKMVGETLEQHCSIEFNKIRASAFPEAYFEKDNDSKTGSKGDFIFRDYSDDIEYISIMFEMKNENETTAKKHKNEDFLKELDKDRNEKNCEYAVLVSMLEADNELYNEGIVDVSHKYPKMYVIRPQFFIPLISLLRNASKHSIEYKKQLIIAQNQNLDIRNFENNLLDFKDKFGKNFLQAKEKFQKAIDEIDKTIDNLKKVKENLLQSENKLRLANDKAQNLSVKKLTKDCPSVAQMFSKVKEFQEE
ncbi:MAG: DUF2130 domain-containing protein [Clostridia bacterium]|nr:DUF2130 domain-containing protein [Clostridia bacterium]